MMDVTGSLLVGRSKTKPFLISTSGVPPLPSFFSISTFGLCAIKRKKALSLIYVHFVTGDKVS